MAFDPADAPSPRQPRLPLLATKPRDMLPHAAGWFALARTDELPRGGVRSTQAFGRELVLFRGESGEAHVVDAFCPHLGAHLGAGGTVAGEAIRCPFHAWEFDGTGRCIAVPYAKKIPPRARLPVWPTREVNGYVFAYFDGQGREPTYELFDALTPKGSWVCVEPTEFAIRTGAYEILENAVDRAHFRYVHSYTTLPETRVEVDGVRFRAVSEGRARLAGVEIPTKLDITMFGPGLSVTRIHAARDILVLSSTTPHDESSCVHRMTFWVAGRVDPVTRWLVRRFVVGAARREFEADIPIWEHKQHRASPVLADGDGPIMRFRKWYRQFLPSDGGAEPWTDPAAAEAAQ